MARETEKAARKDGKPSAEDNKQEQSSKEGGDETANAKGASAEETVNFADVQREQFDALKAVLDKRNGDEFDGADVVREFACLWVPMLIVDIEELAQARQREDAQKAAVLDVRRDIMNILLADLLDAEVFGEGAPDEAVKAKLEVMSDAFDALVKAFEQERDTSKSDDRGRAANLGQRTKKRFEYLKRRLSDVDQIPGEVMDLLAPRNLSIFPSRQRSREPQMARYSSSTPDRDERGRFVSDEDRDYSRGRRGGLERDEYGRFMSEGRGSRGRDDDDERYGRRSMSRSRDDDEYFRSSESRGRGRGGWFGDSEGHSEASRRGWDNPRHGESGWYGDPEGHSQASRRGWDNPRHGESGWFGDSEGHSEASRRGWDNPRHGESGWYGDPEGHSEASHRGWEGRSSASRYRDDERDYRSSRGGNGNRSRHDDDDDRRSSRGRGHGGWSGDSEGHSEAARRGWDHRR